MKIGQNYPIMRKINIMDNLKDVIEFYKKENINPNETMFIEMIDKYKSWQLMTDEEKLHDKNQSNLINIKLD